MTCSAMLDNRLFLFAFADFEGLSIIFSPILFPLFRASQCNDETSMNDRTLARHCLTPSFSGFVGTV